MLVIKALTYGVVVALVFGHEGADWADLYGVIGGTDGGVAKRAAGGVDDEVSLSAASADSEQVFAFLMTGADAEFAQDAAVKIEHDGWVAGVYCTGGVKVGKAGFEYAEEVGDCLELASAAFFAARAEVVAFDKQHLGDHAAISIDRFAIVFNLLPGSGEGGAGRL